MIFSYERGTPVEGEASPLKTLNPNPSRAEVPIEVTDEPRAGGGSFGNPKPYRGTSLIRNSALLGPYSRTMHRALWWVPGGDHFLMSEVPL